MVRKIEGRKNLDKSYSGARSLLNHLLSLTRTEKYVFRGVSKEEQMYPSIKRYEKIINFKKENKNYRNDISNEGISIEDIECRLLYEFRKHSSSLLKGNLDLLDVVAYAQHFGIPTRLLDWTRDPYIALYFAIKNNKNPKDGYYRLYYCDIKENTVITNIMADNNYGSLKKTEVNFIEHYNNFIKKLKEENLNDTFYSQGDRINKIIKKEVNKYDKDGMIFYDTNASNPRLIAQEGLFSIPKSLDEKDLKNDISYRTKLSKISIDAREDLLVFLENMNYTSLRLFPDLQNISKHIIEKNVTFKEEKNLFKEELNELFSSKLGDLYNRSEIFSLKKDIEEMFIDFQKNR
jgi:hypothetical protein